MKSVLLLSCLLLVVGCIAGKSMRPPMRNATRVNTSVITKKSTSYLPAGACIGVADETFFPNADGCEYFWTCVAEKVELGKCKDDMWFDSIDLVCDYEDITCYEPESGEIIEEIPNPDSECPPRGGTNVVFLPSKNCNEYYICVNGVPNVASCSPGNHWNPDRQFCDHPASAGCTNVGPDTPLPDCKVGFTGVVPHPWNCNWFVFCSNGNRSVQQCPHLQHFDIEQERCLLLTIAKCVNDL